MYLRDGFDALVTRQFYPSMIAGHKPTVRSFFLYPFQVECPQFFSELIQPKAEI
jgi:hypothetical protein